MEKIKLFISSANRNKLIISKDDSIINCIDFGNIIAQELQKTDRTKIAFRLNQILDKLIITHKTYNNDFDEFIAIKNIGILLEPELKFNFEKFLENYSQNLTVYLKWEGDIENNQLYFLDKTSKYRIDMNNISHIVI